MTFYMYYPHDDSDDLIFSNINAYDLPGVLRYLHDSVVGTTPRKDGIARILRYKVTMRNDFKVWAAGSNQFAAYAEFDEGRCTKPVCDTFYQKNGYSIGCKVMASDSSAAAYLSPFVTRLDPKCQPDDCNNPVVYSLPGPCPSVPLVGKNAACAALAPGGACAKESDLSRPGKCTYFAEPAGQIRLDELVGITSYKQFAEAGRQEYDSHTDKGLGVDFWDAKRDSARCMTRMDKVQALFLEKYPSSEDTLGEPPCDASE
jgi:hypothetical protein